MAFGDLCFRGLNRENLNTEYQSLAGSRYTWESCKIPTILESGEFMGVPLSQEDDATRKTDFANFCKAWAEELSARITPEFCERMLALELLSIHALAGRKLPIDIDYAKRSTE